MEENTIKQLKKELTEKDKEIADYKEKISFKDK